MSKNLGKILSIVTVLSILHLVEDSLLFVVGRYTEVSFLIVLVGAVSLSLFLAVLSRNEKIKKFIGS